MASGQASGGQAAIEGSGGSASTSASLGSSSSSATPASPAGAGVAGSAGGHGVAVEAVAESVDLSLGPLPPRIELCAKKIRRRIIFIYFFFKQHAGLTCWQFPLQVP
jgi:hypothetical protein